MTALMQNLKYVVISDKIIQERILNLHTLQRHDRARRRYVYPDLRKIENFTMKNANDNCTKLKCEAVNL